MIKLKKILENKLKTNKGSIIQRFKNNVGKKMGNSIYVHKLYANEVIPPKIIHKAEHLLKKYNPDFSYNCIMFDPVKQIIRFDESPDFNTSDEPIVGNFTTIRFNTNPPEIKHGYSDNIWHHKWLWVKDDYNGFDVNQAKERSKLWLSKLNEQAKGTLSSWNKQLHNVGLISETNITDKVGLGQFGPNDEIQFIWIPSIESRTAEHSSRFVHRSNRRFRLYPSGKNTAWIYWGANPPTNDELQRVDDFFHKKGIKITVQRDYHLNNLNENINKLPPVVLGAVNPSLEVMSINGVDDYSRHPLTWSIYSKWRYVPEIEYLYWWESPTEEEKLLTIDYLERKGYNVRKSSVLTMRENNEADDEDESIDIDKLFWNDSYLDSIAEKFNYVDTFNEFFWKFPSYLYHCTKLENKNSIISNGIKMKNNSRGFSSNRNVGPAIFTTSEQAEISTLQDSYGPVVFIINTIQMKKDGYTPTVEREPDWARAQKLSFVLKKLNYSDDKSDESLFVDSSEGTTPYTVIVYGNIPPKYITEYTNEY